MRVFSQINKYQQKKKKKKKKERSGAPLLGLAKYIYFILRIRLIDDNFRLWSYLRGIVMS